MFADCFALFCVGFDFAWFGVCGGCCVSVCGGLVVGACGLLVFDCGLICLDCCCLLVCGFGF